MKGSIYFCNVRRNMTFTPSTDGDGKETLLPSVGAQVLFYGRMYTVKDVEYRYMEDPASYSVGPAVLEEIVFQFE